MMDVDVERPAMKIVRADEVCLISLVDRGLQPLALEDVLAPNVDIAGVRLHRDARDQAPLDQEVRIVAHDLPVFAGSRFGFVRVDDEVGGTRRIGLWHEGPLETGREAGAPAPAQAGGLHLVDDPLLALLDQRLRAVPCAARARALEPPVAEAVEVGEDAVFVVEHR